MTRRFTSTVAEPYPRGLEFGRAHATEITATVQAYLRLFALQLHARADGTPAALPGVVDRYGEQALDRIDAWSTDLAAEIRGIAAGAGHPPARIAAINARTEILARLQCVGERGAGAADECSTVVSLAPPNLGGRVTAAMQNWDWYDAMSANWLEWTIPYPDGRRVNTVTEFGVVGKIGVNNRGVGTLFNILHHRTDGAGIGVPVHVIARTILDTAGSVVDGLRTGAAAVSAGVHASTSITIVDRSTAVSAEFWPGGLGEVYPDDAGLLIHTNDFLTTPAADGDTWAERDSDTIARRTALHTRLGGRPGLDPAAVFEALTDHGSGLCCHPEADAITELRHATLATVALDLAAGELRISDGTPCRSDPSALVSG